MKKVIQLTEKEYEDYLKSEEAISNLKKHIDDLHEEYSDLSYLIKIQTLQDKLSKLEYQYQFKLDQKMNNINRSLDIFKREQNLLKRLGRIRKLKWYLKWII